MEKAVNEVTRSVSNGVKFILVALIVLGMFICDKYHFLTDPNSDQTCPSNTTQHQTPNDQSVIYRDENMRTTVTVLKQEIDTWKAQYESADRRNQRIEEENVGLENRNIKLVSNNTDLKNELRSKGDSLLKLTKDHNEIIDERNTLQTYLVTEKRAHILSQENLNHACDHQALTAEHADLIGIKYNRSQKLVANLARKNESLKSPLYARVEIWHTLLVGMILGFGIAFLIFKNRKSSVTTAKGKALPLRAILNKAASFLV